MLSKTCPERVSKKNSKHVGFLTAFESQKGDQNGVKIDKNGGLRRALGLQGPLGVSEEPFRLNLGSTWDEFCNFFVYFWMFWSVFSSLVSSRISDPSWDIVPQELTNNF